MKKTISLLTLVLCLLCAQTFTFAASGKAVIPFFDCFNVTGSATYSHFTVSNITESTINVKVTLYKADGTIIKDDNNSSAGLLRGTSTLANYNDNPSDNASITFTLEANKSGYFSLWAVPSQETFGYGTIEWTQDSKTIYGLVSFGNFVQSNTSGPSRFAIPINGGLPF